MDKNVMYYGSSAPIAKKVLLNAGKLTMVYEEGFIRYIRLGDHEVLRMINHAVRDHNWGTVPIQIENEKVDKSDRSFSISYDAVIDEGDIQFKWHCRIEGKEDESITFEIEGLAGSDFKKNRTGFTVLHPIDECVGQPVEVTEPSGAKKQGEFPSLINPHQPFMNIQSFAWRVNDQLQAVLDFEGDIFEMEDQRNWTDASYKTYCTPLEKPFPVLLKEGDRVDQKITLRFEGEMPALEGSSGRKIEFRPTDEKLALPDIGIGRSTVVEKLANEELQLLTRLKFDHYRTVLRLYEASWQQRLTIANDESIALGAGIELVLIFKDYNKELEEFKAFVSNQNLSIKCILILSAEHKSTPQDLVDHVIPELKTHFPGIKAGAGTDAFFTELNRERVTSGKPDFLSWSLNPQVHAFDNDSLTETLAAQPYTVNTARSFADGKSLHVSPVSFKMRWNPNATGPQPAPPEGQLPSDVDPRQMSLYGAAWTVGSIKYLAEAGADIITYFETVGWKGIIQGRKASPLPDKFRAAMGDVFPVWQVFKWISECKEGQIIVSKSSSPLDVDGLIIRGKGGMRIILVNFKPETKTVSLEGIAGNKTVRKLDETNYAGYVKEPDVVDTESEEKEADDNTIELMPFGLVCVDC